MKARNCYTIPCHDPQCTTHRQIAIAAQKRPLDEAYIRNLLQPLKDACDRDWKDETPEQIVAIAANAIYWRGSHDHPRIQSR